jgi:hypothetical protein
MCISFAYERADEFLTPSSDLENPRKRGSWLFRFRQWDRERILNRSASLCFVVFDEQRAIGSAKNWKNWLSSVGVEEKRLPLQWSRSGVLLFCFIIVNERIPGRSGKKSSFRWDSLYLVPNCRNKGVISKKRSD